jgi:hypothetical protein
MNKYIGLDVDVPLDLLARHTSKYTAMRKLGIYTVEEITHQKEIIRALQGAILFKCGKQSDYFDRERAPGMTA